MSRGLCKLAKTEGTFVRAHIIPRAFYSFDESFPLKAITNNPAGRAKRIPIGIYDESMLIETSEAEIAKLDDYAIKLLRPDPIEESLLKQHGVVATDDGIPVGYGLEISDYRRLKLFFMSILWRAGATSREEFNLINLGSHLETLRVALRASDPLAADNYAVVAERFVDGENVPVTPLFGGKIRGQNLSNFVWRVSVLDKVRQKTDAICISASSAPTRCAMVGDAQQVQHE